MVAPPRGTLAHRHLRRRTGAARPVGCHRARRPLGHRRSKAPPRPQHSAVRAWPAGQQRPAVGRTRHGQVVFAARPAEPLRRRGPALGGSGQTRVGGFGGHRGAPGRRAVSLSAGVRRPLLRSRRCLLQGIEECFGRFCFQATGQCADLRHLQSTPLAAGIHGRQRRGHPCARRTARKRGHGRKSLLVGPLRAMALVLPVPPRRLLARGQALAGTLERRAWRRGGVGRSDAQSGVAVGPCRGACAVAAPRISSPSTK